MNIIEKRKNQLRFMGIVILLLGLALSVGGVVLILNSNIGADLSVLKLIFGIVLAILGISGISFGVYFVWIANSLKATKGSIAEDNSLAKGTANMHKCENCGEQVEPGVKICAKCEENLKP